MNEEDVAVEERAYAPPPRFDATIGYWTGEPDEDGLVRSLERVRHATPEVTATRCRFGHIHLRGPRAAVAAAEAALSAELFTPLEACDECS